MKTISDIDGYKYAHEACSHSHAYLMPTVLRELSATFANMPQGTSRRVFDLGCGNGSVGVRLSAEGYEVTGVDPSAEGIAQAHRAHPELKLATGSAYDDLSAQYGQFPAVISLEVVEHVYDPRHYARTLFSLVQPGGTAIVSTPYHGYLKNVALAVSGKMDAHFTALWDHGHIKFWSRNTLGQLLTDAGFWQVRFERVGRVAALAKSMIAIARKP
jgi:2-polyprenyl-3-methyl-5-hydroxy-6-metoxy-1,4-benzoquinol methylase